MTEIASIEDVRNISRREALRAGRKILGVTTEIPRYEQVPDSSDPEAVFEFVVDCYVLEGISQQLILGAPGGQAIVRNVLVGIGASGDLFSDIHVPVEIQRDAATGQLYISGRAKVNLPTLRLDEYSLNDLNLLFVAELTQDEDGNYFDAFGYPALEGVDGFSQAFGGSLFSCTVTNTSTTTTLGQLNEDAAGNAVLLGVNPLQRSITTTTKACEFSFTETLKITEGIAYG